MLTELFQELRNWFTPDEGKHFGQFTIEGGQLNVPFLADGQCFRIVGSVLNDGVYRYPTSDLNDESFEGAVWAMSVPPSVLALAAEIEQYNEKHPESPFNSETFDGYSYTRSNSATGWAEAFASKLRRWRKICP